MPLILVVSSRVAVNFISNNFTYKLLRYFTAPADYLDARATKFQILKISYLISIGIIVFEMIHNTLELLNLAVRHGLAGVYSQNMPIGDTK